MLLNEIMISEQTGLLKGAIFAQKGSLFLAIFFLNVFYARRWTVPAPGPYFTPTTARPDMGHDNVRTIRLKLALEVCFD